MSPVLGWIIAVIVVCLTALAYRRMVKDERLQVTLHDANGRVRAAQDGEASRLAQRDHTEELRRVTDATAKLRARLDNAEEARATYQRDTDAAIKRLESEDSRLDGRIKTANGGGKLGGLNR